MKRTAILSLLALFAGLAPAFAGEVLVPLASAENVDGAQYVTRVWVSNQGGAARRFTTRFIAMEADGTRVASSAKRTVPPGRTLLLTNVAPQGKAGMLWVSGAPQLSVAARVETFAQDGRRLAAAHQPVVSGLNLAAPEATLHLQGLARNAGIKTDLQVVNAAEEQARCTVQAYRANGSKIQQAVVLTMKPLSVRSFRDTFAMLGESEAANARIAVSCDHPFFAYAKVARTGGPELNFVTASAPLGPPLGESTILGSGYPDFDLEGAELEPGAIESVADDAVAPDGTVTLNAPGVFLKARRNASFKEYVLPFPQGVRYKRATIEFDLFVNKWQSGLFHSIAGLRRSHADRPRRVLYVGMILRGSKGFKSILDIGKDPRTGSGEIHKSATGPWREKTNFHVKLDYDIPANRVTLQAFRGGQLVHTLAGDLNNLDLSKSGQTVRLNFGAPKVADGAYFPPVGWIYSDLKATFRPF
jgi:hypothetical protein